MLIYHPAFDAYHCVFRMLKVLAKVPTLEFAKLRILDFYLCFPAEVSDIQIPREQVGIKKAAKEIRNEYRGPVSVSRTFRDMEAIHLAAARLLASSRFLDPTSLENGIIVRTETPLPEALDKKLQEEVFLEGSVPDYIVSRMSQIPLTGMNGLKQRTGLMEYRYDAA
ncbi:ABC-three component system middle component 5 [Polaromonas sp.]|uniref:ABC-three component system middle component 5 n=1 Tax=Polaromonas sp. TaxID=1869339 RepID=UPI00248A2FD3|nr:ABC-three component system middle component 5 [Polaromonas sp.]MDI1275566.1 hypothetical protein [Polaromonas sp.]